MVQVESCKTLWIKRMEGVSLYQDVLDLIELIEGTFNAFKPTVSSLLNATKLWKSSPLMILER